jgi:RNA polymerase-binding transcription factor DksA
MDESAIGETLRAERAAAVLRLTAITSEFDGIVADSQHANADDEHDPEGSTIAYERARVAALIAGARSNLEDLDRALDRLSAGCYSLCEGCGGRISPERLAALPAGRTCFACARVGRARSSGSSR